MGALGPVAAPFWIHCVGYDLRRAVRAYERRRSRWERWLPVLPVWIFLALGFVVGGGRTAPSVDFLARPLHALAAVLTIGIVMAAWLFGSSAVVGLAEDDRDSGRIELVRATGAPLWGVAVGWLAGTALAYARYVIGLAPFYLFVWIVAPDASALDAAASAVFALLVSGSFGVLLGSWARRPARMRTFAMAVSIAGAWLTWVAFGLSPPPWALAAAGVSAAVAIALGAWGLGRAPRGQGTRGPSRWSRAVSLDAGARFIAANAGTTPGLAVNGAILLGGLAGAVYYPLPTLIALIVYVVFTTYAFAERVWSSPLLEDLFLANWDPVALSRQIPRAAFLRTLPAAAPLVLSALHYGAVTPPASPFPNSMPVGWETAFYQCLIFGGGAVFVLLTIGRIASQRVIQGGKSTFGIGASVQQAAIVCGILLYGGVYVLGILYPVAGFFTGSAEQRSGFVFVVLISAALIAVWAEMNSRREFENAILRYANDNAFSDFGAFRPLRRDRPSL